MSLQDIYKKAGVVMKPAAMKDGKLYSQQPHSGAGDFNFSRADGVQTRINKHGLIETVANNEPRLSYDLVDGKVSDCPHLLLEPSRYNALERSEEFDTSYWAKSRAVITANQAVSPDGSQTADKYRLDSTSNRSQISIVIYTVGTQYTTSLFVKYDSAKYFYISNAGASAYRTVFDIENGTIISTGSSVDSSKIENYGNGWYRCSVTFAAGYTNLYYKLSPNSNNATFTNTTDFSYIWGAQIEQGSYPTSYIPTSGSSEQRQDDICNGSGNSETFNDSEGVLFAEISAISDSTFKRISIDSGSYTDSVVFDFDNTNNLYGKVFVGGSAVSTTLVSGLDIDNNNKLALKYKSGDYALWVNGVEFDGGTNINTPTGLNSLNFELGGFNHFYGKCKQLMVFNEALTDEQMQLLTTS